MSATGTGVNESYLYDADGQRIKKTSTGTTTYYPNQFYEQYGTSVDKYYYFNGQPIALRRNGTLYYMHQDQIGNLALVTSGGAQVDAQGFYAYGRLRIGGIGVERSFTGQQKDTGTGLIYFKARYYDPELGTFISPDTLVPDAGNLFDYNRYMFVRGNPLKYNDPDGHSACAAAAPIPFIAVGCQIGELAISNCKFEIGIGNTDRKTNIQGKQKQEAKNVRNNNRSNEKQVRRATGSAQAKQRDEICSAGCGVECIQCIFYAITFLPCA